MKAAGFENIDAYIEEFPLKVQKILHKIREE